MKKILVVLLSGLMVIVFGSCMKLTTDSTFGYDCPGDMLVVSYISESTDNSYWNIILDAVNEYRNSPDYVKDDVAVRSGKIEDILSGFEGKYIAGDSIGHDSDCVYGSTLDGGTFKIGIHDTEWYSTHG